MQPSEIEYIDSGLDSVVLAIERYKISSIAIAALSCGLCGLNCEDVRPRIVEALASIIGLTDFIYEPTA